MKEVVHILTHLGGGVGQVITNIARQSEKMGRYHHVLLCLDEFSEFSRGLIAEKNVHAYDNVSYEDIYQACSNADIVQLDWWNHPLINLYLSLARLPAVRLLVYSHVSGFHPPAVFTQEIMDYADIFAVSTPFSTEHELIKHMPEYEWHEKIRVVFVAGGSTERVADVKPIEHKGFNITYVGTVDFCKMHECFVSMSAKVQIPDVNFIVCGGEMQEVLLQQARTLNKEGLFDFRGFVSDIRPVFEISDVFGYPLCKEHYGTGEQALLEAMAAGLVPLVFNHGAESYIVENYQTGILVNTPQEYTRALEFLYNNPEERRWMGNNAKQYAKQHFTVKKTVETFYTIYDEMMTCPKRERNYSGSFSGTQLLSKDHTNLGALVLMNSLGGYGKQFQHSFQCKEINQALIADEAIANSTAGMKAKTKGSVLHYSDYFPDDVFLKFWCGLIAQKEGDHKLALDHFQQALSNGFEHWRICWYLSLSAYALNELQLAQQYLHKVLINDPHFELAHKMSKQIQTI